MEITELITVLKMQRLWRVVLSELRRRDSVLEMQQTSTAKIHAWMWLAPAQSPLRLLPTDKPHLLTLCSPASFVLQDGIDKSRFFAFGLREAGVMCRLHAA